MKYYPQIPEVGQKVKGKHLLGAEYTGKITARRPYTMDNISWVFFIEFDSPVLIAPNDIRTEICVQVDPPQFKKDTKWQGGNGDWFEVIN